MVIRMRVKTKVDGNQNGQKSNIVKQLHRNHLVSKLIKMETQIMIGSPYGPHRNHTKVRVKSTTI